MAAKAAAKVDGAAAVGVAVPEDGGASDRGFRVAAESDGDALGPRRRR